MQYRTPRIAYVLLAALPILAGCATRQGFEQRMSAYIGRSEGDLVASLGVPLRTFESGNRRFLQFERRRVTADSMPGWGWGWGSAVEVQSWDCSVTFEVAGGRVESFTSRGNDCVATAPS